MRKILTALVLVFITGCGAGVGEEIVVDNKPDSGAVSQSKDSNPGGSDPTYNGSPSSGSPEVQVTNNSTCTNSFCTGPMVNPALMRHIEVEMGQ